MSTIISDPEAIEIHSKIQETQLAREYLQAVCLESKFLSLSLTLQSLKNINVSTNKKCLQIK